MFQIDVLREEPPLRNLSILLSGDREDYRGTQLKTTPREVTLPGGQTLEQVVEVRSENPILRRLVQINESSQPRPRERLDRED
jgi:hypothetical protein